MVRFEIESTEGYSALMMMGVPDELVFINGFGSGSTTDDKFGNPWGYLA
jgi:hypothetical protein